MGLSIHYNGIFNHKASLPAMIEEVKDIVEIYKWKYHIYETNFPDINLDSSSFDNKIYGISFTPPECETVSLCFLSNGRLSSNANLRFYGNAVGEEAQYLYMLSVKTQFAGWQIHVTIIQLLKYLSKKYFQHLSVDDEGGYWEAGEENVLQENFKLYTFLINSVSIALQTIPTKSGETMEAYFKRILKQLQKKHK